MLTKFNRKNSDVNGVEPEKMRRLTGKKAALTVVSRMKVALTALNWKNSGGNAVEPDK